MYKILSIGNSFSEDSTKYLHQLAACGNIECKVVNLYIGGCSLERHWNNILDNKPDYDYQLNGSSTGKYVTIKDTLTEDAWDIVTIQQVSGYSGILNSYYPYIINLAAYIKEYAPKAKQLIHQTWAYEIDSTHEHFSLYHQNQEEMYLELVNCYEAVAKELSLEIIPFGNVIQKLRMLPPFDYRNGGISLCRDGFHMNLMYGRYALAATWYEYVLHGNIIANDFLPETEEQSAYDIRIFDLIKQCVHELQMQETAW